MIHSGVSAPKLLLMAQPLKHPQSESADETIGAKHNRLPEISCMRRMIGKWNGNAEQIEGSIGCLIGSNTVWRRRAQI